MHAQPLLNGVIGNTQLPFTNYKCGGGGGGVVYMCVWYSTVPTYIHTYVPMYIHPGCHFVNQPSERSQYFMY